MPDEAQIQQFREHGYFILPDLFSAQDIDVLVEHIDYFANAHETVLKEKGTEGISRANEISFTTHLAAQDPVILHFVARPEFVEVTTSLLGPDVELYWDQSVYKKPETKREFPWHQDTGYVLTDPIEYVTCWLALNDVSVENGGIWLIPDSHHQGVVEHKNTDIGKQCYFGDEQGIPVPLKKGSMVVFSSLAFHRSGPNLSNGIRKGYVIQYSIEGAKNGVTGNPFNGIVVAHDGQPVVH
jgi:ectoine hydroxylase-related dioxygenase (phytanoyl-CoA dioxygenase family)